MSQDKEPPSISLQAGDRLMVERGAARPPVQGQVSPQSGTYQVRLFREGKDQGLITYKDEKGQAQAVTLSRENPTLKLEGSGKDASVEISRAAGMNAGDYIPRLDIRTENPVKVVGSFTSAAESTQKTIVAINPVALANVSITKEKGGSEFNVTTPEDAISESDEKNKNYANPALLLKLKGQSTYTVAAEKGSPGIQFVNPRDKGAEMFVLNGKESLADNQKRFAPFAEATKQSVIATMGNKKATPAEKGALGIPAAIPEEKAPTLSDAEKKEVRTEGQKLSQLLGNIGRSRDSTNDGNRIDENPAFKPFFDEANSVAAGFANKGSASPDTIRRMDTALDKLIEQADKLSKTNRGLGNSLKEKLEKAKDSFGRIRELGTPKEPKKTGMAEGGGMSKDLLAAAREAVDPMIRGQKAETRTDGSPDAPRQVGNPLSNSGERAV